MSRSMGPWPRVPSGRSWSGSHSTHVVETFSGSFGGSVRKIIGVRSVATGRSDASRSMRTGYSALSPSATRDFSD